MAVTRATANAKAVTDVAGSTVGAVTTVALLNKTVTRFLSGTRADSVSLSLL